MARALQRMTPYNKPHLMLGKVTRQKICQPLAPNTMPLHVEILYNEYQSVAAFAVASLLALLALVTLVIKTVVEWQQQRLMAELAALSPERPVV